MQAIMGQTSYRVLVVDDEPQIRTLTSRALAKQNFICDQASDGEEALAMLRNQKYDAMVTDLKMPHRHGHALIAEVMGWVNRPRVFVLTALLEPRLVRDLLARGVEDVIHKPVPYDLLAVKVEAAFEKAKWQVAKSTPAASSPPTSDRRTLLAEIEKHLAEVSRMFSHRLQGIFDFEGPLPSPPKGADEFIARLEIEETPQPVEGQDIMAGVRSAPRVTLKSTAIAVPVNSNYQPVDNPFGIKLRDISRNGVRMLHTRSLNVDHLALRWTAETLPFQHLSLVVEIKRCRALSRFYDVGGSFATTL